MKIAVIGSGIAGLAVSIRLAHSGHQVTVFEANDYPGGKLTSIQKGGYRFDAGPSLFTMPHYVEELLSLGDSQQPFDYEALDTLCHYFYPDGTRFQASSEQDEFVEAFSANLGVAQDDVRAELQESKRLYELTSPFFLEKSLNLAGTYLNPRIFKFLGGFPLANLKRPLAESNRKRFANEKAEQYFNRFATYNGSDPYQTPAIMGVIPHLEHGIGAFFPKGGMHEITLSLVRKAKSMGVEFHFSSPVEQIVLKGKGIAGVRVNGVLHSADKIVSNSDVRTTYRKLLQMPLPKKLEKAEPSSSALIFYWGIARSFPELSLHNIFFSSDYQREFSQIFRERVLPEDPTVYVNITSKRAPADAPEGGENWFVMVNAPYNEGQEWNEMIHACRQNILKKISAELGHDIESLIEEEDVLNPMLIEERTSSHKGSIYGQSSNHWSSAFLRQPNFSSKIKGLYFCGGSVHPGGGIPLCLLSAKITADVIQKGR